MLHIITSNNIVHKKFYDGIDDILSTVNDDNLMQNIRASSRALRNSDYVNPDAKREYIKIMKAETINAVEDILDNMALLRQQAEQAAVKQQQEAAAANSQMQADAQQNIAATSAAASMENKDAELDQKLTSQLLTQEHEKEMAKQGEDPLGIR